MTKVLTQEEEDAITAAIYNDDNKTLFKSLPTGIEDHNDGSVIEDLAQGQEYYILPQTNLMLRKDGKLLNVKFIRQIKPLWTPHDVLINSNGKQIRYTDIFKKNGWTFNHREIMNRYIENKWPISITTGYRERFKELYG